MESRAQASRPTTQKISETKDSPSEDRPIIGQRHRHNCSPKKMIIRSSKFFFLAISKKGFQKFFLGDLQKTKSKNLQNNKVCKKIFHAFYKIFKDSKTAAVFELMTGQFSKNGGFEDKVLKMCSRGLHLCQRNVTVELKNS